ncbi:MAG: prepilin-type N-terminal cleavage/methylation domain-containing protein [Candidatus Omnitrophica bacterium]|nr:prepilin-type N-terminal cleavage/methylation domain-containing protein [Candidatus Omnitrophota bacterium]
MISRIGNKGAPSLRPDGFTFIEVLLAVVILTIGAIGIIRVYVISLQALAVSQDYINEVYLAKEKMAQIQQNEIEQGGLPPEESRGEFQGRYEGFGWQSHIAPSDEKDLNTVNITVFHGDFPPARELSLVAYGQNKK